MWAVGSGTPEDRTSVAGLAYLSEICTNLKYSISEEKGSFESIATAAHEIGHK